MKDNDKARFIVKIFLTANKGKYYTSKQLCEFINGNDLGVKWGVTSTSLSKLLSADWLQSVDIKRRRKNSKNVWEYCVV